MCIAQDDIGEKEAQLKGMTAIYANAYLITVAAGGSDANCGLLGEDTELINGGRCLRTACARGSLVSPRTAPCPRFVSPVGL